jgi:aminotransferase
MPEISNIAKALPPSGIRKFFDIVSQMKDVISLGVGEPDFVTPWSIRESGIDSLERGYTNYTSNYGLIEVREAVARHLNARYAVRYNPEDEVLMTVGVSEAMDLAMRTVLNPGDECIVIEPCYVSYQACVTLAGGVSKTVVTRAENNWAPTVKEIADAITPKTKAILLGFPANPTGATVSQTDLQAIIDLATKHDLFVISDEIYDRLCYDEPHICVASLRGARERTILLNGFSKAYAMTGWRLGYACAPAHVLGAMMKIHSFTMLCASNTAQRAAINALAHGESAVQDMVDEYNRRRRLIVAGLNDIGLHCHMPKGAFYAFPSIKSTGLTSEDFATRLLFEENVAVVPGTAFGECGEGYIRCSYATARDKIEIALDRIGKFVKKNVGEQSPVPTGKTQVRHPERSRGTS